jgi:hypothetical protein
MQIDTAVNIFFLLHLLQLVETFLRVRVRRLHHLYIMTVTRDAFNDEVFLFRPES